MLHVYNRQQLKHRLNLNSLYIVSTKSSGFSLEVSSSHHNTITMVGIRVMLGSKSTEKAPSYVEVFGRTHQVRGEGGKAEGGGGQEREEGEEREGRGGEEGEERGGRGGEEERGVKRKREGGREGGIVYLCLKNSLPVCVPGDLPGQCLSVGGHSLHS